MSNQNQIVDDLLTKPSVISPTLFVGLGGCGCRMVRRIAEHLRRRPDYKDQYEKLVKFALVDTNINDLESYREIADETLLISDFEKEDYADLASGKKFLDPDEYFTQWVPQNYRFRAGDTAGAGQIRIESRLGVFYQMKHKDFVPRFRRLLEALKSHELGYRRLDSQEIRIVLCYSVAGGTGSGCHLPIAYMLRDLAEELGKPTVIGVAVLPAVFEDKTGVNRDGTFANGYAALQETEHLMKLGAPESRFYPVDGRRFHYNPLSQDKTVVRRRPFEFLYVIDKPESFHVAEPVDAAADGLYLQFYSPLFKNQLSDYDNYTQHQRFLVPHDFEGKGISGYTTFYGSYGAAVLLVPEAGLVDYCAEAAALSIMRSSFVRSIPGGHQYSILTQNRQLFNEATLGDEEDERPIPLEDFYRKEPRVRERLLDRLFLKRVRLLAACELGRQEGRYLPMFRHGHPLGSIPTRGGVVEQREELQREELDELSKYGMRHSIGAVVLSAVSGRGPGQPPGLLRRARSAMEDFLNQEPLPTGGSPRVQDLKNRAQGWVDEARRRGLRVLRDGFSEGSVAYPGFDSLLDLDFLRSEAGDVDLAAKRYAVLSILEQVTWTTHDPEAIEGFELTRKDSEKVKDRELSAVTEDLRSQALDQAMARIQLEFNQNLGRLQVNLRDFAHFQQKLETSFDAVEQDRSRALEQLREKGDDSANAYVLDGEALQIETGRRMWDFYYEDRVTQLTELQLGNKEVQQRLSDTVTDLSISRGGSSQDLEMLFDSLKDYAKGVLRHRVGGDVHANDRDRRWGLTLSKALELEVVYRALYHSHAEDLRSLEEKESSQKIREILSRYNNLPDEEKLDFEKPVHRDYLRDKIQRLVKEKASLLCTYEGARDQHGGVRPDHIFLAAIDENFENTNISQAIQGADNNLHWVTTGWKNPKEIIFYRAVLNVPLYVFGRLQEMQTEYYRFKDLARRPKVLHIDKNWEDGLPDLDPDTEKEKHRQDILRSHVINFATLLTLPLRIATPGAAGGKKGQPPAQESTFIVRRRGVYYLRHPDGGSVANSLELEELETPLGSTLAKAIEKLPEVLEAEQVKYRPLQRMLDGVRKGFAPSVLEKITQLPFEWRRSQEQLRQRYGSSPGDGQRELLGDFRDAYSRLKEALESMLGGLRNASAEYHTLNEDVDIQVDGLTRNTALDNLGHSTKILRTFVEQWAELESGSGASQIQRSFEDLFQPMEQEKLESVLASLGNTASTLEN
ncbi:MAG: tubulin-like doman-containing protein [Acidobacteriota bacterium]